MCDVQWWLQKEEMAMSLVGDWVWSVKCSFKLYNPSLGVHKCTVLVLTPTPSSSEEPQPGTVFILTFCHNRVSLSSSVDQAGLSFELRGLPVSCLLNAGTKRVPLPPGSLGASLCPSWRAGGLSHEACVCPIPVHCVSSP